MPNHWHLVLSPDEDGMMGRLLRWVTATHTLRYHAHYHSAGEGHLYQSRFKSFPCQSDEHYLSVCRYVERNPLRARLVKRAEQWRFGSLYRWFANADKNPSLLSPWPIRRTPGWIDRVHEPLTDKELARIRTSIQRGRPYGDEVWTENMADQHGLWPTLRPRGRPSKS
jgi:putative transposase